jgi:hypothetical protein
MHLWDISEWQWWGEISQWAEPWAVQLVLHFSWKDTTRHVIIDTDFMGYGQWFGWQGLRTWLEIDGKHLEEKSTREDLTK